MKNRKSILIFLVARLRTIFCFGLVIALTLACNAAMAELSPIVTLEHGPYVRSVAFSPDGKLLATAGGR